MAIAEAMAGLGVFKSALDVAKGLKDITDPTARRAAVIELQEKILTAQAAQTALVDRVRELEAQVARFEAWEREKERYQLTDYGAGTFAYALKPEAAGGEPPHRLCAACYQKGHKSILQTEGTTTHKQERCACPECKSVFNFGTRQPAPTRGVAVKRSWTTR